MTMTADRKRTNARLNVTEENERHVSDFYYAVQISACMLKPIGAWPLADHEATSGLKSAVHRASTFITTLLQLFTIVPWIVQIIKEKWSAVLMLRTMCPLLFTLTVFARYILLMLHQGRLKSCMDRVADDWRCSIIAEDRRIMLANAKMGRTFGIVSVTFMFSCGALFYVVPLVPTNLIDEDNVTVRLHATPCELLVVDSKTTPVYEIVYLLQMLSGYTFYSAFCGICSLMSNFVAHVCGQCDVLALIFDETVNGDHRDSVDDRIADAIDRHLRLLRFVFDVSGLFTEICLMEFVNASCNICLLGYYIITDLNNNESFVQIFMYVFALASIVFNIFMHCYIGDLLAERCQRVASICYEIEWYRMPPKIAIELIMPIAMSRYPITLNAGKMMSMTLTTFSDILKTSMAYFNLLREFTTRDVTRT